MTVVIRTEGLSKKYCLGATHNVEMLQERLVRWIRSPRASVQRHRKESFWALRDVSLDINDGDVVGLVGRNGAGKSTLLKLISRITFPTRGCLTVHGRVGSLLEVGTGFHPEMTGRENVYLNGSILGMSNREITSKLEAIVDFAGVAAFLDTPIKRYSSGMALRLGFGVAAHLEPEILLVDEVLAVGDAEFQNKCLKKLSELQTGGRTVLFVSHNLAAVENLCKRVIWIDAGRTRDDGAPSEVIAAYLAESSRRSGGRVELDDLAGRGGSGDIRFTRLELLVDGEPRAFVRTGEEVTFRLHFRAQKRVRFPHFGLKIYSSFGALISEVSTWASGVDIPEVPAGESWIDLTFHSLDLMPNQFYISLWCASVGDIWYDVLDRCSCLDVVESDFFGSGRGINQRHGVLALACQWQSPHVSAGSTIREYCPAG